ncbi:MAG: hypothetical protein U9Q30_00675 [Campylobacterota bacterium]|nr:hypothetical protein [Campylobacterota bacterium]
MATKLLDSAEYVWDKEINQLGFKEPINSDTKLIDIYIGNNQAYNYETNSYENIGSYYAGWATSYNDNTPYFLVNPILNDKLIKVTISHEFFHTIQYTYFNPNNIKDDKWFKNIWWLEATAVLMEDEVYDDINDYINFIDPYFNASYKNIELYNGSDEYAKVIFAKYIKEKYGFKIIKDSLSDFEYSGDDGFFEILDKYLKDDYNSSMQLSLNEFAKWISNSSKYFEEGELYPSLKKIAITDDVTIEKGGIINIDNLEIGWNMSSISTGKLSNMDIDDDTIIWGYKDNIWQNNITTNLNDINSSDGYWIKTNYGLSRYFTYFDTTLLDISTLEKGWHLKGTTNNINITNIDINKDILVWQYKNNQWYLYTNIPNYNLYAQSNNIQKLETIEQFSSYWIYIKD